jgi:adenylate kinase
LGVSGAAPAAAFVPGPILLMGAPGVGKGTQAKALVAAWGIPQISTGDLLRANIAQGTSYGREAKGLMDAGQLVPDELVNSMVAARLREPDVARGYILDGYPRTIAQAEWLDTYLAAGTSQLPVVAVSISVAYTQLLRRTTGRRICPVDGSIYNVYFKPPRVEGRCDLDGAPLTTRADDAEAAFTERMRVYGRQTEPVLGHYRAQGRLVEIDGEPAVDAVTRAVMAAVEAARRQ